MSIIVKPNTFSAGATIIASQHNSNFDTIYNDHNGNIDNTNIVPAAAIAGSKLTGILQSWSSVATGTNIQVTTDILICAGGTGALGTLLVGYTDATATPTTMVACATFTSASAYASITFPVKKNNYYKILKADTFAYSIPLAA